MKLGGLLPGVRSVTATLLPYVNDAQESRRLVTGATLTAGIAAVAGAAAAAAVETASLSLASMLLFRDMTGVEIVVVVLGAQREQISICALGVRQ